MTQSAEVALVDCPLVKAHMAAGFAFFLLSLFAGMLYALQLSAALSLSGYRAPVAGPLSHAAHERGGVTGS